MPCFLSSSSLVRLLLSSVPDALASDDLQGGDCDVVSARESWQKRCSVAPLDLLGSQPKWEDLLCEVALNDLLVDADQLDRCRLLAAKSAHSAAWLEAVPIPVLGNFLGAEELRVAVALRVGANISGAPTCLCKCGVRMNAKGYHGLSCRLNKGRLPRHAEINSILKRCPEKIGLLSILEPSGFDRSDGRRPDGIRTFPWKHGQCLGLGRNSRRCFFQVPNYHQLQGSSAKSAEILKSLKYQGLVGNFHFQPVAFETTGCCRPSTSSFVEKLGRKVIEASGDPLEAVWLRQKISLAIARGNATSILSCFRSSSSFSVQFFFFFFLCLNFHLHQCIICILFLCLFKHCINIS